MKIKMNFKGIPGDLKIKKWERELAQKLHYNL